MCARDTAVTTLSHPRGAGAEARGAPPGVLPASAGYPPAFQTPEGASVAADGAVPNPLFASGDRGPSSEAAAGGPSEAGADAGRPMPAGAAAKSSAQPDEGLWEDQSPGGPRTPGPAPAASSAATPERQGSSHPDRMAGMGPRMHCGSEEVHRTWCCLSGLRFSWKCSRRDIQLISTRTSRLFVDLFQAICIRSGPTATAAGCRFRLWFVSGRLADHPALECNQPVCHLVLRSSCTHF